MFNVYSKVQSNCEIQDTVFYQVCTRICIAGLTWVVCVEETC